MKIKLKKEMKTKIGHGANIFENGKAYKTFGDAMLFLPREQGKRFSKSVKDLYAKKLFSENGEFTVFGVTFEEINLILKTLR